MKKSASKKILFLGLVIALFSCQNHQNKGKEQNKVLKYEKPMPYKISGSGWEEFDGESIRVQVRDTIPQGYRDIAESTIENGTFTLEGKIQFPQNANVSVYNEDNQFIYSRPFVLEPANIVFTWEKGKNLPYVEGGAYNGKMIQEIYHSKEIYNAFIEVERVENLSYFEQDTLKLKAYQKIFQDYYNKLEVAYSSIRNNDKDPMARILAMSKSNIFLDYSGDYLSQVSKEVDAAQEALDLGEIPELTLIKDIIQLEQNRVTAEKQFASNKQIKDFVAEDLNGVIFSLSEQLKKNQYILVEFWASWCAPCREEIPHMKKVYDTYNKKGFEIVSFSIDDKKERWKNASEKENIPWINVSDLKAMRSPVAQLYGISGIPANYLVNHTGTIIAENLRGQELNDELTKLLGE